ncbi:MAG: hypothetical protein IJA45_03635 [Oscillospiraceae bacterium]|nr:hypothetical protein [Oscillospiraceae bacterium]
MQYITAKQASEQWGLTDRRVQDLCRNGQISGAVRWGRVWMIPKDAHRPVDRRRKEQEQRGTSLPLLPKKNPAIVFTNLYQIPGSCDAAHQALQDTPESAELFRAQMAYCQGNIDIAYGAACRLLEQPCSHDLQMGCGIVIAMCAMYRGNEQMWRRAKECIQTAKCNHPKDRSLTEFWSAAMDSELFNTNTFPAWFARGCFDPLPADSYPAARYYYLKYLYILCHESAVGLWTERDSQNMLRMFPLIAEPFISQTRKVGSLISEIYMRLICAVAYHNLGNNELAVQHLDTAISQALADKLYMILAEYRMQLDFLMDERLVLQDTAAAQRVKLLSKHLHTGWVHLHNTILGRKLSQTLTTRERETARLAAYGLSNKEIAQRLDISVNTVKQSLRTAMDKTGSLRRSDLAHYV